jgi:hypothetical protein
MVPISNIANNSDGFLLFNLQSVQAGFVCTTIDAHTINQVRMNHSRIQGLQGVLRDKILNPVYAEKRL